MLISALLAAAPACAQLAPAVVVDSSVTDPARQQTLVRIVRQDCGFCHGMQLTGGLGPAPPPEALADVPFDAVVASIVFGRPGTPMPGWKTLLSMADATWIARQLQSGSPQESKVKR